MQNLVKWARNLVAQAALPGWVGWWCPWCSQCWRDPGSSTFFSVQYLGYTSNIGKHHRIEKITQNQLICRSKKAYLFQKQHGAGGQVLRTHHHTWSHHQKSQTVFQSGKWPEQRAMRHIWLSKVESGLDKGQSVTYGLPKWKVAWTEGKASHTVLQSGLNTGKASHIVFQKWKVAWTKGKASHMVFQSGKRPEQTAKCHIWFSKVERDPNRGNYSCAVFQNGPRPQ